MKAQAKKAVAAARKSGAFDFVPSEKDVQNAYAAGASTLREAIEWAGGRLNNPAKWERCIEGVEKKGGANAYAVCSPLRKNSGRTPTKAEQKHIAQLGHAVSLGESLNHIEVAQHTGAHPVDAAQILRRYEQKYGADMVAKYAKRRNPRKRKNPAAEAIEGYEAFHGKAPDEFVTVSRKVHFHKHLSGAGKLKRLVVKPVAGRRNVILSGFGGALLAFNESRNQLFVEGGDQSIDLSVFGIDTEHELETLGQVVKIEYFTTKDHLGDEGGTATYVHKFRTTNENGKHVTIRIARYPDLIYRVLDKQLEFSGGSYKILPEGIDE